MQIKVRRLPVQVRIPETQAELLKCLREFGIGFMRYCRNCGRPAFDVKARQPAFGTLRIADHKPGSDKEWDPLARPRSFPHRRKVDVRRVFCQDKCKEEFENKRLVKTDYFKVKSKERRDRLVMGKAQIKERQAKLAMINNFELHILKPKRQLDNDLFRALKKQFPQPWNLVTQWQGRYNATRNPSAVWRELSDKDRDFLREIFQELELAKKLNGGNQFFP